MFPELIVEWANYSPPFSMTDSNVMYLLEKPKPRMEVHWAIKDVVLSLDFQTLALEQPWRCHESLSPSPDGRFLEM